MVSRKNINLRSGKLKIIQVNQGSQEWLSLRAKHPTASEAPAVMGASKYLSRSDLMKQKATGITQEVNGAKQALFDRGHAAEEGARAILEEILGEALYPVTVVCEETNLLASLDGLTMMGDVAFECKLWNEGLAKQVYEGELGPHYYWQLEQQLLVTKAEKVIFVTSDGTREKFASMEYRPVPGRREQLIAGWRQFNLDLAAYATTAPTVAAVAAPVESLPAVSVRLDGQLVVASNLPEFGAALRAFIERIPTSPSTDQQFADCESACKALKKAEDALESSETHALAQMLDVNDLRRTIADLRNLARQTRLASEKAVAARKEQVRIEIVQEGNVALREHIIALNKRLGHPYMPAVLADFAGAIKGKRTIDSLRDAVSTTLANAKIEASATADRIQANLATLCDLAKDHAFLFADTAVLVLKANDDLTALVKQRIAEHQAAEAAKLEAQRARIRAEEQAKAEADARAKLADEQAKIEQAEAQRQFEERLATSQQREDARQAEMAGAVLAMRAANPETAAQHAIIHDAVVQVMMPATVRQAMAPKPVTPPSLRIGEIANRLGFGITAAFLRTLGFEPAGKEGASVLFHEADFPLICNALINHIGDVVDHHAAVEA